MKIRIILLSIVCAASLVSTAQTILPDATLNEDFANYVKSLDEFMHRFNGEELHPSVKKSDTDYLRKNLFWLFNFDVKNKVEQLAKMKDFVKCIIESDIRLAFKDSTWFAKASFVANYKGKNISLIMFLRTEPTPKTNYCWKICGIQGIEKIGLYAQGKQYSISNIEHEMNFVELCSIFSNNRENIFGYMSARNNVDQLSVFITLCKTGLLTFNYVNDLSFIFTSVPGYVFTVSEYARRGNNSGWLISSFEKCDNKQKYINNLIN